MTLTQDHRVTIERRGRSHKCVCSCGWTSHSWNELRPAEADAWHHVFGEEAIVDVSAIPDERSAPGVAPARGRASAGPGPGARIGRTVEDLVRQACELADRPSPYTRGAALELWRLAGEDPVLVRAAMAELVELLALHDRRNAGAADSQWLQLITAKRLLGDAGHLDERAATGPGRQAAI